MRVLAPRSDMTGADRAWAARYRRGDVLHYPRGSKDIGIEKRSYAQVVATQPKDNLLTVQKAGRRASHLRSRPGCAASAPTARSSGSLPLATGCSSPRPIRELGSRQPRPRHRRSR